MWKNNLIHLWFIEIFILVGDCKFTCNSFSALLAWNFRINILMNIRKNKSLSTPECTCISDVYLERVASDAPIVYSCMLYKKMRPVRSNLLTFIAGKRRIPNRQTEGLWRASTTPAHPARTSVSLPFLLFLIYLTMYSAVAGKVLIYVSWDITMNNWKL